MNFVPDQETKYDICGNCRNNYPRKLGISEGTAAILCRFCKGIKSNYEPIRPDEYKILEVKNE
jgi:hypothetical protein